MKNARALQGDGERHAPRRPDARHALYALRRRHRQPAKLQRAHAVRGRARRDGGQGRPREGAAADRGFRRGRQPADRARRGRDHDGLRLPRAQPGRARRAPLRAGRHQRVAADPDPDEAVARGQAARRADVLGARSDAGAFRRGRRARRHAGRRREPGRRVPEGDLRTALRRQRRGARGGGGRRGAPPDRAAQGHRRDPVRVHQFSAAPRRGGKSDRPAGVRRVHA